MEGGSRGRLWAPPGLRGPPCGCARPLGSDPPARSGRRPLRPGLLPGDLPTQSRLATWLGSADPRSPPCGRGLARPLRTVGAGWGGGSALPSCSLLGPDTLLGSLPSTVALCARLHLGGLLCFRRAMPQLLSALWEKAGEEKREGAPPVSVGEDGGTGDTCGSPAGQKQSRAGGARGPGLRPGGEARRGRAGRTQTPGSAASRTGARCPRVCLGSVTVTRPSPVRAPWSVPALPPGACQEPDAALSEHRMQTSCGAWRAHADPLPASPVDITGAAPTSVLSAAPPPCPSGGRSCASRLTLGPPAPRAGLPQCWLRDGLCQVRLRKGRAGFWEGQSRAGSQGPR